MFAQSAPLNDAQVAEEARDYLSEVILPGLGDILLDGDAVTVSALIRSLPPDDIERLRHRLINSARRELGKATRMAVTNAIGDIFR